MIWTILATISVLAAGTFSFGALVKQALKERRHLM
jgi:hypothetical protein